MFKRTSHEHEGNAKKIKLDRVPAVNLYQCALRLYNLSIESRAQQNIKNKLGPNFIREVDLAFQELRYCLQGADEEDLQAWSEKAQRPLPQIVGYLLSNCGYLAHLTNEYLTSESVAFLLKQITGKSRIDNVFATKCFTAINSLVREGRLDAPDGVFRSRLIEKLAEDLTSLDHLEQKTIIQFLCFIGALVKDNQLDGQIDAHVLNQFLKRLCNTEIVDLTFLTNTTHLLGIIANKEKLSGKIEATILKDLCTKVAALENNTQFNCRISNMIYGVGMLARKNAIDRPELLCPHLEVLLQRFRPDTLLELNASQVLFSIEILSSSYNFNINSLKVVLGLLVNEDTKSPYVCANLIHNCFDRFKIHHKELDNLFNTLINKHVPKSLNDFPPQSRTKILQSIRNMEGYGNWSAVLRTQLGLNPINPIVVQEAPKDKSLKETVDQFLDSLSKELHISNECNHDNVPVQVILQPNNPIYQAIATFNLNQLKNLLGITLQSNDNAHSNNNRFFGSANQNLVLDFFGQTSAEAMMQLVEHSEHDYFQVLLQTLSLHERHQLAIRGSLKLVIKYLPHNQLSLMVNDFISCGLCRGHLAIKQLCDALDERIEQQPTEFAISIRQLQLKLVNECINVQQAMNVPGKTEMGQLKEQIEMKMSVPNNDVPEQEGINPNLF